MSTPIVSPNVVQAADDRALPSSLVENMVDELPIAEFSSSRGAVHGAHQVFDETSQPIVSPSKAPMAVVDDFYTQRYESGAIEAVGSCLMSNFGSVKEAREVSGCNLRSNSSLSSARNVFDDMFKPECRPDVTQIVRAKVVESKFEVSSKPMAIVLDCVKGPVSCMEPSLWWLPCSLSLDCILSDVVNAWEPYFGCVIDLVVPSWAKNDCNCFCAGRMFVDTPCCPINGITDSLSELVFDPGGSLGVVPGKVGNRCGECEWQAQLGLTAADSLGDLRDEMLLINVYVQQWDTHLWFYTLEDKGVLRCEEMVQDMHNMRKAEHLDCPWSNGVILPCETENSARARLYCGLTICSGNMLYLPLLKAYLEACIHCDCDKVARTFVRSCWSNFHTDTFLVGMTWPCLNVYQTDGVQVFDTSLRNPSCFKTWDSIMDGLLECCYSDIHRPMFWVFDPGITDDKNPSILLENEGANPLFSSVDVIRESCMSCCIFVVDLLEMLHHSCTIFVYDPGGFLGYGDILFLDLDSFLILEDKDHFEGSVLIHLKRALLSF